MHPSYKTDAQICIQQNKTKKKLIERHNKNRISRQNALTAKDQKRNTSKITCHFNTPQ